MHKLTVTLKQHTPLIHFQHDQEGATLRASEVKPKLDRFIISRLTDEQKTEGRRDGWLKEKEGKCWLDYKMRLKSSQPDNLVRLSIVQDRGKYFARINTQSKDEFPFLLCNMGGKNLEEELMNLKFYKSNQIEILCGCDPLISQLQICIPPFFALTNFGQRTTKGFGSFSVTSLAKDNEFVPLPEFNTMLPNQTPIIRFKINRGDSFENQLQLFQVLDFYWKCLKSGVNYTKRVQDKYRNGVKILYGERYIKPYLWTYLNTIVQRTWEKKLIKETFSKLQTKTPKRSIHPNNNTAIFARGMMGCPMFFEYKVPTGEFETRNNKLVEKKEEYRVSISNNEIERIASPIIFKPIIANDNMVSIYVLLDNELISVADSTQSKQYTFTCEKKCGNNYVPIDGSVSLNIEPMTINYLQLIQKYHYYIGTDAEMANSVFANTKIVGDARKFKMIPRNFRWDNILGQTDANENLISFFQVKHNKL